MAEKKITLLTLILSALAGFAAFLVYMPALDFTFVNWDDPQYVTENALLRLSGIPFIKAAFTEVVCGNWHPLTVLSLGADFRLWNLDPKGYHLTNNIVHGLNTSLVFLLASRLYALAKGASDTDSVLAGLLASVLFGLHPLRAESVAWIAERKDVLSAFFFMASLLAYLKYRRVSSVASLVISFVFFALALLSKPMAITLPAVLLIVDYYPLRRLDLRRAIIEKIPFFALSVGAAFVTLWAQKHSFAKPGILSLEARILNAAKSVFFYLYKLIVPVGLAPYYPHPVRIDALAPEYLGAAVLALLLTAISIILVKKGRLKALPAAWAYYLVTLLPVLGIIQVGGQAAADRYTYIPFIGVLIPLSALIVIVLKRLSGGASVAATVISAILIGAALSYATVTQASVWKDPMSLWTYELSRYPSSHVAYNNRGLFRQNSGDMRGAIEDFNKAVESAPELAELYNNRGAAYQIVEDYAKAIDDYRRALSIDPSYRGVNYNLGLALQKTGDNMGAIESYTRELKYNPYDLESYLHRGLLLRDAGRPDLAIEDFTVAMRLAPGYEMPYVNRGITFYSVKAYKEAAGDLGKALELNPESKSALYYMAVSLSALGRNDLAIPYLKRASSLGLTEADEALKTLGAS